MHQLCERGAPPRRHRADAPSEPEERRTRPNEIVSGISGSSGGGALREARRRQRGVLRRAPRLLRSARFHDLADRGPVLVAMAAWTSPSYMGSAAVPPRWRRHAFAAGAATGAPRPRREAGENARARAAAGGGANAPLAGAGRGAASARRAAGGASRAKSSRWRARAFHCSHQACAVRERRVDDDVRPNAAAAAAHAGPDRRRSARRREAPAWLPRATLSGISGGAGARARARDPAPTLVRRAGAGREVCGGDPKAPRRRAPRRFRRIA